MSKTCILRIATVYKLPEIKEGKGKEVTPKQFLFT